MRKYFVYIILLGGIFRLIPAKAQNTVLFETNQTTTIYIAENEKQVVHTSASLLQEDVRTVFDANLHLSGSPQYAQIIAGTIGQNPEITRLTQNRKIDLSEIEGKWEAFQITGIQENNRHLLVIAGSDSRGTAYGLLELSRMIGVSPWHYFADSKPEKQNRFEFPDTIRRDMPSVRYRGIFLNDEDWGLMPWATQTLDPQSEKGAIGNKAYQKIFELLLRLRANTIWPAMHESTVPFYFVKNNKEAAGKYGIVIGTSHCEPLMRNSASEWDVAGTGDYNYVTNRENILSYWTERLKELKESENIFTIGMRGKHDGIMQGIKSLDEHKFYLSQIINDQQDLLKRYINHHPSSVPQVFIPYKEVLEVYDAGLEVPDYVTLVWCDDNYGCIRRLPDEKERLRSGSSGVYYHVSYWGRPHDYLWLATTSPALIYTEMKRAYEHDANRLWILNVGDLKPAEYLTEFFLDLAWSITDVFPHLQKWTEREFGKQNASEITAVMTEYYRLANIRKPEFMGWNRVEEPDYPRGLTPVKHSEYNPDFHNELQRRIQDYLSLENAVKKIKKTIPQHKQSAFFQLVEYPVLGASLINQKWLYAQWAHQTDTVQSKAYAAKSIQAYREIEKITEEYNHIENGKWNRMMDFRPRKLPVFDMPDFSGNNCDSALDMESPDKPEYASAQNARQAINLSGNGTIIKGLGHSFAAVQMKQGNTLTFTFDIPEAGEYWLKIAAVPNHDVDGKGMKISLSIDGKTVQIFDYSVVGRSETWKQNVLRGQAVATLQHYFVKAGKITVSVSALTPYIILDQIMIGRGTAGFYEFPVKN